MINLVQKYKKIVEEAMMKQFKYKSIMQVPRIEKICINYGCGDATKDSKLIELAANEIKAITGQKPVFTKAKNSIAAFKLREGQKIGVKVTLQKEKMWNFIENLINVALPRVRDFRGIPTTSFDGRGNYTLGIKEQIIFTEVNFDEIKRVRGFDITFVTSTNKDFEALALLTAIGLPFMKKVS